MIFHEGSGRLPDTIYAQVHNLMLNSKLHYVFYSFLKWLR